MYRYLFFLLFTSNALFSQLNVIHNGVLLNNGDTISNVYYGPDLPMTFFTNLGCKNNSQTPQNVFVKCDKSDLAVGTEVRMCWAGTCYGPALDQTLDTALINISSVNNGFEATYYPNDLPNTASILRFTFIDSNHESDSAWIYCRYGIFNDISYDSLGQVISANIAENINSFDYKIEKIVNSSGQELNSTQFLNENELYFIYVIFKEKRYIYKIVNHIK